MLISKLSRSNHAGGVGPPRIVTLRGATRGSAGVPASGVVDNGALTNIEKTQVFLMFFVQLQKYRRCSQVGTHFVEEGV